MFYLFIYANTITQQDNSQSIVEEFTRMVSEAANRPSSCETAKTNYVPKYNRVTATASPERPQTNAIINNIVKADIVVDNKVGADVEVYTPVVSAISDSPVIVPKMTNTKYQKSSESNIDNKPKPKAKKPNVPHNETENQWDIVVPLTTDMLPPQPQRIREPRERVKPMEDKKQLEEPKVNGPSPSCKLF